MDFFNKLGKKTSAAFETAKEKTSKISEELKLKGRISDFNDKITEQYQEIGKMVYEKMKAGEDASKEDIVPKCEEIERLKDEIEKAQVELLALKDIKKCVKCGQELELKSEFCSKCGEKQPKLEEPVVVVEEEPIPEVEKAENAEVTEVSNTTENNDESN